MCTIWCTILFVTLCTLLKLNELQFVVHIARNCTKLLEIVLKIVQVPFADVSVNLNSTLWHESLALAACASGRPAAGAGPARAAVSHSDGPHLEVGTLGSYLMNFYVIYLM